jgi:hypothetical protein
MVNKDKLQNSTKDDGFSDQKNGMVINMSDDDDNNFQRV